MNIQPRRGMALVIVTIVVGVAALMGYALLGSAALESQVSSNSTTLAQAECLAESGINLAMLYLQSPSKAPASSSW